MRRSHFRSRNDDFFLYRSAFPADRRHAARAHHGPQAGRPWPHAGSSLSGPVWRYRRGPARVAAKLWRGWRFGRWPWQGDDRAAFHGDKHYRVEFDRRCYRWLGCSRSDASARWRAGRGCELRGARASFFSSTARISRCTRRLRSLPCASAHPLPGARKSRLRGTTRR